MIFESKEQLEEYKQNKLEESLKEKDFRLQDNNKYKMTVEKLYNRKSWYYFYKKDSQIINLILENYDWIRGTGISVDDIIKTFCSILNYLYTKNKEFFRVPDRYLTIRNQLSRQLTEKIIILLAKSNIIDLLYVDSELWIKLNWNLIDNDEFIEWKRKSFLKSDAKAIIKCEEKYNNVYFYSYTKKTIYKHLRRAILGLSLAYSLLRDEVCGTSKLNNTQNVKINKRDDIMYIDLPLDIICNITHKDEYEIMAYICQLCKNTNYISRHNKSYVDSINGTQLQLDSHFVNNEYKKFDLKYVIHNEEENNKYYEDDWGVQWDKEHYPVKENSLILYIDNFNNSETGKFINKHIKEYMDIIKIELLFKDMQRTSNSYYEYGLFNTYIEDLKKENIYEKGLDLVKADYNKSMTVINLPAITQRVDKKDTVIITSDEEVDTRLKFKVDSIQNWKFTKCGKMLRVMLNKMSMHKGNTRYMESIFNKIVDRFKYWCNRAKKLNKMDIVYNCIEAYQLQGIDIS